MKKLSDYIEKTIDNRGRNPKQYFSCEKYPVIDNYLIKNTLYPDVGAVNRYIDEDTFENFLRGYVHKNMPLMTLVGNGIGNVTLAPCDDVAIIQNTVGFQCKEDLDEIFLYYYLLYQQEVIKRFDRGSGQPSIKKTDLLAMNVDFPELAVQEQIRDILLCIDEKIEVNKSINNNLLQQAQALYKKTFPYSTSDDLPDNWCIGTVGDIVEIHDSKRVPLSGAQRAKMKKKTYPYYGAASLMDYVDDYIFDGKYLLLGEDGTVVDDAGYPILQYVWGKFWVNNHAHIMTGKSGYNIESLYMLFKHTSVSSIITGAVQLKISQANLRSIPVVIPPVQTLSEYNSLIEPMFSMIRANEDENQTLSSLRDGLLPKLMSGELDISNIEI